MDINSTNQYLYNELELSVAEVTLSGERLHLYLTDGDKTEAHTKQRRHRGARFPCRGGGLRRQSVKPNSRTRQRAGRSAQLQLGTACD